MRAGLPRAGCRPRLSATTVGEAVGPLPRVLAQAADSSLSIKAISAMHLLDLLRKHDRCYVVRVRM